MTRLRLALAALGLVLAAEGARAEPSTLLTALEQIPAAPALHGKTPHFEVVDLAALSAASDLPEGLRLAVWDSLTAEERAPVQEMLRRIAAQIDFMAYLLLGGPSWPEILGFDFFEVEWVAEVGEPPRRLLFFGGEALPEGEGLAPLARAGLQPETRGGTTVWARGADYAPDLAARDPEFPFWGALGMSVRIFRSEAALVGARAWPDLELALAVAQGRAESLADLPRYRLALAAAADPALSEGPVLQMAFFDLAGGAQPLGQAQDGLPPFGLFAFADRQDESGQQAILVLTYDDREIAEATAVHLAESLPAYRDRNGATLGERFEALQVDTSVYGTPEGAAVVVRLAIPPAPARDAAGKVLNRSRLYEQIYRMLLSRDLGFLAPRG